MYISILFFIKLPFHLLVFPLLPEKEKEKENSERTKVNVVLDKLTYMCSNCIYLEIHTYSSGTEKSLHLSALISSIKLS
jgi:hypothetical protein